MPVDYIYSSLQTRSKVLQPTQAKLSAYGRNRIPVLGRCQLNCTYKSKSHNLEFYVVNTRAPTGLSLKSQGSKSSTHYLSDKNRFDSSSKGPSSGISVGRGGGGGSTSEYIETTRDKIKTNQMDLIKTRNK